MGGVKCGCRIQQTALRRGSMLLEARPLLRVGHTSSRLTLKMLCARYNIARRGLHPSIALGSRVSCPCTRCTLLVTPSRVIRGGLGSAVVVCQTLRLRYVHVQDWKCHIACSSRSSTCFPSPSRRLRSLMICRLYCMIFVALSTFLAPTLIEILLARKLIRANVTKVLTSPALRAVGRVLVR